MPGYDVTPPETVLNGKSVKIKLYKTPSPPYFIVLARSVTAMGVKAIQFHKILKRTESLLFSFNIIIM